MNSCVKGKVGEREWATWLRSHGFTGCRRGQQFSGSNGDADVVGVTGLHFESKRVESLNLGSAMKQAISDAGDNCPLVVHRKNRGEWMVTLRAEDMERVALAWTKALAESKFAAEIAAHGAGQ